MGELDQSLHSHLSSASLNELTLTWLSVLRNTSSLSLSLSLSVSVSLSQDTAGSERYEAMSRIYYRGARAAIVCYGKY